MLAIEMRGGILCLWIAGWLCMVAVWKTRRGIMECNQWML